MPPSAYCERISQLSVVKFSEGDLKGCIEEMQTGRDEDPKRYECLAGCVEDAKSQEDLEPCSKKCVSPLSAVREMDREGTRNLGSLEVGSKNMFQQETDGSPSGTGEGPWVHRFCPSSKSPLPAELPPAGKKVLVPHEAWNDPTWTCLKFSLNEPQYFQYSYENNGKDGVEAGYVATARRRLPNGKIRTLRLVGAGHPSGDAVRIRMTEKDE
jgi:hypothetical protein